jgi:hypothetical protein
MPRSRLALLLATALVLAAPAVARAETGPVVVRDVLTGRFDLPTVPIPAGGDPIQDYTQPDTQIEPSIAVNPANPLNVVTAYQEGRIASGGDATNGFATSFDGGATWIHGELPGLTTFPGQHGVFERASDAVVAFGPNNVVYANSLVFDFTTGQGLRSGMAVNVSKDGGRTWSAPVILQDDQLGGLNDKNWIVVDNSSAPGHHKGRVYVVWDRVAPVVYDYCDHDCDQLSNWLPDLQKADPLVFPGQGIGAYPMVLSSGGLGIVIDTTTIGAPTGVDEPESDGASQHVFIAAPAAGQTPYPAPLAFLPPIEISPNESKGIGAQRASDGLPAAAVDPKSGNIYTVWDDARFRSDGKSDAVFSMSTNGGQSWTAAKPINPPPRNNKVNHYNVTVGVGDDGAVHVAYRVRDESGAPPLFTDQIDTYYQESRDAGKTWSAPLRINSTPSMPWFGAYSRNGTFEGDYNQTASAGGYTYVARDQGFAASDGEPQPLTPTKPDSNDASNSCSEEPCVGLTAAGKGHQHQATWVALIREGVLPAGAGTAFGPTSSSGGAVASFPSRRSCTSRRAFTIRLHDPRGRERLVSAQIFVGKKRVAVRRGKRLRARINLRGLPRGTFTVKVVARTNRGRRLTSRRTYHTCVPRRPRR